MPGSLTIRNLTPHSLILKSVERYDAGHSQDIPDDEKGEVGFFSYWTRPSVPPSHRELGEKASDYAQEEVDIRLEAFATPTTSEAMIRKPGQRLRLTLHGQGTEKWRIDVPTPSAASQKLIPLTPNPTHEYTTVYIASLETLAILECSKLECWMKDFGDNVPLTALSIPGSHNSHTCYTALPSVRCQAVSVREQLENGIRFLDIRVQPTNPSDATDDTLHLVHGAFPISLTGPKPFRPLLDQIHAFLRQNPSETILLSLKREGPGSATDAQLSLLLHTHYARDPSLWYTEPRIPRLGEVRGKIVLLRRFALAPALHSEHARRGWGLDAAGWAFNSADCAHGHVRVQDVCEILVPDRIEDKIAACAAHLERAARVVGWGPASGVARDVCAGPLYLNFLSGSNFWNRACWPERIAARLNPAMLALLCEGRLDGDVDGEGRARGGDGGLGVVVCDWVGKHGDWDLVRTIVAMNGRLLLRR